MFCWLLYVPVGSVDAESPMCDGRIRNNFVMESLLDKELSHSVLSKDERNVLTPGEALCSAFLQVYESSLLPVKEMETRLFHDLVLSGLGLLLAGSQSAKLLALKREYVKYFVCSSSSKDNYYPPIPLGGLLESTLETMKTIYSKLSLSAVEFPTASKKVGVIGFAYDTSVLMLT